MNNNVIVLVLGIAGYVGSGMYKKMGGEYWVWNINLNSALFIGSLMFSDIYWHNWRHLR